MREERMPVLNAEDGKRVDQQAARVGKVPKRGKMNSPPNEERPVL